MGDAKDGEGRRRKLGSEDPTIHESAGTEGETLGPESAMDSIRTSHGTDVDPGVELDAGPVAPPASGHRRYTVRGEIARGGMGAIFKVRDEDLRRSLAMKVMLGKVSRKPADRAPFEPDRLARFLEEAQVTAQLAHPGVVPVHELGVDETGRVFFTMSLVRGKTLSEVIKLAREGKDGWDRARALQTLLRVCETVAFAHDKGVIHRDLKPANIMVGKFGEVYVMDWGLAKVRGQQDRHDIRLHPPGAPTTTRIETDRTESQSDHDSPIMTMDGAVVGTPCYMPPEQAKGQVEQVDERSDVYAVGAMLYQLLTGQPPYVEPGARISPRTLLVRVLSGPPQPIQELAPEAPAELQAIADKAMERDSAGRYESAKSLAEDVQRFLSGHVVQAHKTGALIEFRKWVARNRGVAATVAAALVVIVAVTGYFIYSLAEERENVADQRNLAVEAERRERERADEAERAKRRAEDLASFMLSDLRDRLQPIGRVDVLHEVSRKSLDYYEGVSLEGATDEQLRRHATSMRNLGSVLRLEGDLDAAVECYRDAAAIVREPRADPPDEDWGEELVACHTGLGYVLAEQGDHEAALSHCNAALEVARSFSSQDPDDPEWRGRVGRCFDLLGAVHRSRGDFEASFGAFGQFIEILEQLAKEDPTNTDYQRGLWLANSRLADTRQQQGDLSGALRGFRASREIATALTREDPSNAMWQFDLSVSHHRVADILLKRDDVDGAFEAYGACLDLSRRLARQDPSNAIWQHAHAVNLAKFGLVHLKRGEFEESIPWFREAVERLATHANDRPWFETQLMRAEFLAGQRVPTTPAEYLELGVARADANDPCGAVGAFERALADERIRSDLERENLYRAACVASLAAAQDRDRRHELTRLALEWLSDDVARRRRLLADITRRIESGDGDIAELTASRASIIQHFERVRIEEADLDALRDTTEFEWLSDTLPGR